RRPSWSTAGCSWERSPSRRSRTSSTTSWRPRSSEDRIPARAARAAERSERGVRTRRASPAGARGGEPLADLAAAPHPDPEAWPEGENPRGDRLPAVAVRPRRWQVVDGEPERREEAGEPHEIRDEHAGRHAVEPGRGRPAEVHR